MQHGGDARLYAGAGNGHARAIGAIEQFGDMAALLEVELRRLAVFDNSSIRAGAQWATDTGEQPGASIIQIRHSYPGHRVPIAWNIHWTPDRVPQ